MIENNLKKNILKEKLAGKGGPGKYSSLTPKATKYPQPVSKQLKVNYNNVIGAIHKGIKIL